MAKARPARPAADEPEDKGDGKKPTRSGVNINLYIDEDIRHAMDQFIADHNLVDDHPATIRSTVEAALKMYLKAKHHWPPQPRKPDAD